jgi:hypothetical protein
MGVADRPRIRIEVVVRAAGRPDTVGGRGAGWRGTDFRAPVRGKGVPW